MRTLLIVLALASAGAGLSACSSDGTMSAQNAAAIRAFEPVNSCGPGGTQDINQCSSNR
ncbi:hypothetical protein SAMN02745157_3577 [Kaistia soli DSM 19436]|uniref:Uncharacterized protein n=1 Tax=Kaistia soli DSM 19436 TaxID=1122133 RepID=A0A1M5GZY7_9HYPH|nr:hypothetical protein [Kaistia soli]SHG09238.1 hypothetical protein SAMN02745157_3577 [Kaistia soli DSM 19436]